MIIQSKKVWVAGQFISAQIEILEGKITSIYSYQSNPVDMDYDDLRIVPGFIDIHTHGSYGFDTNYAEPEGLKNWLKNIVNEGVTGILPTTITQGEEVLTKALKNVADVQAQNPEGAEILGVHFEGPYLDMVYKGAQPPEHILKTSVEQFKRYLDASNHLIKIITMAPEHDDDYALTKFCRQNNIAVSIGHSGATYEQALLAIANGANSMTHIYNGMTPFNHRNNGLVGAALRMDDVYGEVICDGNHSTLAALNILFKAKGKDHAIMITDALMAKGSPAGSKFIFGGHEIEIYDDGSAHLTEGVKSLAGSTLKVNEGLKLLVEEAQVPFVSALNSCTINPAKLLQLDHIKGKIEAGYDADLVILTSEYQVKQTYCKGKAMLQ